MDEIESVSIAETAVRRSASPEDELVVEGLWKRFPVQRSLWQTIRQPTRREWVESVQGVSFSVTKGEFFGILGPNGAGKTTLFKCMTGLITADAGTVSLHGYDVVRSLQLARRQIGIVFANERAMNWRLDARENLRLFAALYDLPAPEVEDRVEALLNLVQVADTDRRLLGSFC